MYFYLPIYLSMSINLLIYLHINLSIYPTNHPPRCLLSIWSLSSAACELEKSHLSHQNLIRSWMRRRWRTTDSALCAVKSQRSQLCRSAAAGAVGGNIATLSPLPSLLVEWTRSGSCRRFPECSCFLVKQVYPLGLKGLNLGFKKIFILFTFWPKISKYKVQFVVSLLK